MTLRGTRNGARKVRRTFVRPRETTSSLFPCRLSCISCLQRHKFLSMDPIPSCSLGPGGQVSERRLSSQPQHQISLFTRLIQHTEHNYQVTLRDPEAEHVLRAMQDTFKHCCSQLSHLDQRFTCSCGLRQCVRSLSGRVRHSAVTSIVSSPRMC